MTRSHPQPSEAGWVTYRVKTVTGDLPGAGTDAKVTLELFGRKKIKAPKGQKGESRSLSNTHTHTHTHTHLLTQAHAGFSYEALSTGPQTLATADHAMERGRTDTFEFRAPDVGSMARVLISHDGQGTMADWYVLGCLSQ